jgi:hypothetical protein
VKGVGSGEWGRRAVVQARWVLAPGRDQGWLLCEGQLCGRQTRDGERWCDRVALARLPLHTRIVLYLTFASPRAVSRLELGDVCGVPATANLLTLLKPELAAGVVLRYATLPDGDVYYTCGSAMPLIP